jgi:methylated-DNA-[protein]-cysteine S-methyltransferase
MTFLTVFPTELGWFGLSGCDGVVDRVVIGHHSADEVRRALRAESEPVALSEADWHPELRRRLERYASGQMESFVDCSIHLQARTEFQRKVLETTRDIPYGRTLSYAELASACGSPGAARAVGNVMASNRVPILIPCHRVVASGGKLGGFSAPQGVELKQILLKMERAAADPTGRAAIRGASAADWKTRSRERSLAEVR